MESTATSPVSPEFIDLIDTPEKKASCSLQEMLKEIERPSGSNVSESFYVKKCMLSVNSIKKM